MVNIYDTVANTWGQLEPLNYGRGKILACDFILFLVPREFHARAM